MFTPAPGDPFREQDLPALIRLGRIPRWIGALLGGAGLLAAVAGLAVTIVINAHDSTIIGDGAGVAIIFGAIFAGVGGWVLWWFSGTWVTLTAEEAVITKAYVFRTRVARSALEDVVSYLHSYATRSGMQYRMIPTLTITGRDDRLRDIPLQFLSWNPKRKQGSTLTPRAAYLQAWAQAGSSPYAYAVRSDAVPAAVSAHREKTRSALQRRTFIVAISTFAGVLVVVGLTVGASQLWQAVHPSLAASGSGHGGGDGTGPVDAQSDRSGVRDLDDSLTPSFTRYQWTEQPEHGGQTDVTFLPAISAMPPAGYTVRYLVRDPSMRGGSGLSAEERKYGQIVSRGTIAQPGEWIEFALDHGDTRFTFEIYVTNAAGHTSRDASMSQNLGGPEPSAQPTS